MKVLTLVGTRPEVIRLSRVIARLDQLTDHVLVHTGQNWDPMLNEVFFEELQIRRPDHVLQLDHRSLGSQLAGIITGTERILLDERPDAFLVLGDTNSSIGSVMAKRMKVPVFHMEAGNRCFDENVPEEINRRLVDHISDFNLVYTEHARRNLLAEGLQPRRILHTGSPMREVLEHYRPGIEASDVLQRLSLRPHDYFLVSAHREENVDDPARLTLLLNCLRAVSAHWARRIVVSTHPRTRKRLEALDGFDGIDGLDGLDGIEFMDPFGFLDYNRLQMQAACVLSDSGTISEESALLGFPAVTLRDSMERPEALDAGAILMTGLDAGDVVRNVAAAITQDADGSQAIPDGYEVRNTSRRVVNFVLSATHRHKTWAGLR